MDSLSSNQPADCTATQNSGGLLVFDHRHPATEYHIRDPVEASGPYAQISGNGFGTLNTVRHVLEVAWVALYQPADGFGRQLEVELHGQHVADHECLLFGAGANISLSRGWEARLEWERYSDVDSLDRDIFSAKFEFKF